MILGRTAQYDALRKLWPAIGEYCVARGLEVGSLLGGD
jgi:DNA-binding XRE family transcriptional regulator